MPKVSKKASKKVAKAVSLKKSKRGHVKAALPASTDTPATPTAGKVVKKTVKKAIVKRVVKDGSPKVKTPRKTGPTSSIDFADGTDMKTAWDEVLAGGASRSEVSARLAARWVNNKTRKGNAKPVSTILNHVVRRGKANGYVVEQTWRLVKADNNAGVKEAASNVAVASDLKGTPAPKRGIRKTARKAVKATKKA